jgi:phosphoenolpyruvate phosphomutase
MARKAVAPRDKRGALRRSMADGGVVELVGASDGWAALLAERRGFDGIWAGGLGISAAHGIADASLVTMTEVLDAARRMDAITSLPVIADCDTGFGSVNNLVRTVRSFDSAGIAGICVEDKKFPKRNSYRRGHELADVHEFAAKVAAAKEVQSDPDFVLIARVEALIAGTGMRDALARGLAYADAGADLIFIHSKAPTAAEVFEFAAAWRDAGARVPLAVSPTTYFGVRVRELEAAGIGLVIYGNHALRAAIEAVDSVLANIRKAGTAAVVEERLASLAKLFDLIGMAEAERAEDQFAEEVRHRRTGDAEEAAASPSEFALATDSAITRGGDGN